jgi:shikimate kinase
MKHLWLIGMMGSGKSEVAGRVAMLNGVHSIDLDERIAGTAGRSISSIFEEAGEDGFRRLEATALSAASREPRSVIATGGGAVLSTENVMIMRETGTVIHLVAAPAVLVGRIGDDAERPLLAGGEAAERLNRILSERGPLCAGASHHAIDTDCLSAAEVAERANALWNQS